MGEPLPSNPALPDTLPWEKQHGPITCCTASLTLTPHVQHISCFLPTVLLDLPLNKGRVTPSAPSWEGQ
ncbi:hypothetical protein INR49_010814 [Scomber scombrus]|uniref:Uncharacterized protein n=1 Tax=Scomber scombrus TaxID=13677 RepID=A0AAV1MVD2_SCOSC